MRISRIYQAGELAVETEISLSDAAAHYVSRVLRLTDGQPLILFNGDGWDYAAEVSSLSKRRVTAVLHARLPAVAESPADIHLLQAVSRGERMDYSLQKATELGVAEIQPLLTERVEVKLDQKRLQNRMQHWQGIIISACEQSGRAVLPKLHPPISLQDYLNQNQSIPSLVLALAADQSLGECLQQLRTGPVAILIGPEGGFSEAEIKACTVAGIKSVALGQRILRTETAGPAAIAICQYVLGDL